MPVDWTGERPLYEVKANLFKGLAHPLRIRVLEVLSEAAHPDNRHLTGGEASVMTLLDRTGLEASHLSQHLAVLRRNHLVLAERRGSQVFYRLAYLRVADLLATARGLLTEIVQTETLQTEILPTETLQTEILQTSADQPARRPASAVDGASR